MENKTAKIYSYLSFKLGNETFASNVSKVLNILEMQEITKVPKAPEYMLGVINLRGKVLPVVDTRLKFGMQPIKVTSNTCILVLNVEVKGQAIMVGALVDAVEEVIEIDDKDIQESPTIGTKYRTEFILGMIESGNNFIMLLDMDMVFSLEDLTVLTEKTVNVNEEISSV